jgi:hypothetical protein
LFQRFLTHTLIHTKPTPQQTTTKQAEASQLLATVAATEGYPFVPPAWMPSVLVPTVGLIIPAIAMGWVRALLFFAGLLFCYVVGWLAGGGVVACCSLFCLHAQRGASLSPSSHRLAPPPQPLHTLPPKQQPYRRSTGSRRRRRRSKRLSSRVLRGVESLLFCLVWVAPGLWGLLQKKPRVKTP